MAVDDEACLREGPLARALRAVDGRADHAPLDKVTLAFKGDEPEAYADKPLLYRIHSAEVYGDGGLVVAMAWGLTLACMAAPGLGTWWSMRRRDVGGWRRYFW